MTNRLIIILIYLSFSHSSYSQSKLTIDEFSFDGIYGHSQKNDSTIYNLIATGFLRAPMKRLLVLFSN